jgi:hypothetical protein
MDRVLEKAIEENALVAQARTIPEVDAEVRKPGHKVLFVNLQARRLLAVIRPDGETWMVPQEEVSKAEVNAFLGWMGKLREYVEARRDRETVIVPIEADWAPAEARFVRIGKFMAEKVEERP